MEYKKEKIEKNFIAHSPQDSEWPKVDDVLQSWENNPLSLPVSKSVDEIGFRSPQIGAIYAIKSFWTVSDFPATIVMPTGTGKTETMIATIVSEARSKTIVVVPSKLLREQTLKRFCTLGKLREVGAANEDILNPVVGCLQSSPKTKGELEKLVMSCNVVVTTMNLLKNFNKQYFDILRNNCNTLIIDEAHHIAADTWTKVKKHFNEIKCLQFTATPFREDGKKIDGDIIYNFPLTLAQEQGYFKQINYYPLKEFNAHKKDEAVAAKAVELLQAEIDKGLPHLLLVRATNQARAEKLFNDIYNRKYSAYNPVLIISKNAKKHKELFEKVDDGTAKIIVCVDMFSEGIDIPRLKICAIHDKYKSLPITMQFIGRFARSQSNLGEASVVANIVDDDINKAIETLYAQDSDWNKLLRDMSAEKIGREVELQKMAHNFTGTENIPITQIRPKVSMFMYRTQDTDWHWQNWSKVFSEENSHYYVSETDKILVITELRTTRVDWTYCRDIEITDKYWNLHILYWNKSKGVFFINTTDKGKANEFAKNIFTNQVKVDGEAVFRCLHGINRLMLTTVGLSTRLSQSHIHYKMYAGSDVADGISNAIRGAGTKSNLFGNGCEFGSDVSIGCSYKGTIWAHWVETIDYWKSWCDKQADKVLDESINTDDILKGVLVPKEIKQRPNKIAYRVDFPMDIDTELKSSTVIKTSLHDSSPIRIDIGIDDYSDDVNTPIAFYVGNEDFKEVFELNITDKGYEISHKSGALISIVVGRKESTLSAFFNEHPPVIWFVDGTSLEGNYTVEPKNAQPITFSQSNIIVWNWSGVSIRKESQVSSGNSQKITDSIQYRVIQELKAQNRYSLIFDDDGSGEIADIVAISEDEANRKLLVELYHCKFSSQDTIGSRVSDLYAVCGQASKSVKWIGAGATEKLLQQLGKRSIETKRTIPRFEVGDNDLLFTLRKKIKHYTLDYGVYIVQPGINSKNISTEAHQILCSSAAYLLDSRSVTLKLICS